ncbi:FIG053235: Diacylglucosamine hydrolase like [Enterobacter cancerogenus]|uniref:Epoxyqueuosine reductase QueH n=1 Tax=Enterobacter cancerogenus TaxID=69218 RepID=A0A484Z4G4_9ENTR|nr:FIG053235: Diacylglucosamine hydrolase like [Enterobacter cancerogenus]
MIEISKREQFYQQEYCGCVYSLRDTNMHRKSQGRPLIKLGQLYYGKEDEGKISSAHHKAEKAPFFSFTFCCCMNSSLNQKKDENKILVSACLMGFRVRYNGSDKARVIAQFISVATGTTL